MLALVAGSWAGTCVAAESPLLAMFDADHDGHVSLTEYQTYMDTGFKRMDRNGNHTLEDGEFPAGTHHDGPLTLTAHHQQVARQFQRQDANHDGVLDLGELMAPPR
ncbi:MAG TPA: hypothetical protein VFJ15_07490 [Oleiagrimonas sp.]|nr:hypothetical protein [Oleiagrimonas sp.]